MAVRTQEKHQEMNKKEDVAPCRYKSRIKESVRPAAINMIMWPDCSSFDCVICNKCKMELQLIHYKLFLTLRHLLPCQRYDEIKSFNKLTISDIGRKLFKLVNTPCHMCDSAGFCSVCQTKIKQIVEPLYPKCI